jgi:hypothetical protein
MRGLYWLTAITLVAAAVTTVAIADYGRRHNGKSPAFAASPITKPVTTLLAPQPTLPTASVTATPGEAAPAACGTACQAPACPTAIKVDEVPEHEQIKTATFSGLAMMKEGPVDKQAFGGFAESRPQAPVQDEFSFPGKKESKTSPPPIPMNQPPLATSATSNPVPSFQKIPLYTPPTTVNAGPEVLPGLHAVKTESDCDANPVSDCLAACAELVTLVSPPTYLAALPMKPTKREVPTICQTPGSQTCQQKQSPDDAKQKSEDCSSEDFHQARAEWRKFWEVDKPGSKVPGRIHGGFADSRPMPQATACFDNPSNCCAMASDKVIVRIYSIADVAGNSCNNHQELIQLITRMVAPDTWETKDSHIAFFPPGQCLVVRHQAAVLDQVDDLLRQLRSAVQKEGSAGAKLPMPVIRMEPTRFTPGGCEAVPMPPLCWPRIITNEPVHVADDEYFGMIPTRPDGRLMPIPTRMDVERLLPATFLPGMEDGPATKAMDKRVPDFFPLALPYAPLPAAPETCEEEKIRTVELQKTATEGAVKPALPRK